jgi:hypothetical protein
MKFQTPAHRHPILTKPFEQSTVLPHGKLVQVDDSVNALHR